MVKSQKRCLKELLLDPSFFRIVYFITLFSAGIAFIDVFSYVFNCLNLIWAIFLSINIVINKKIKNIKYNLIITLFLLVTVITALLHINISFINSYKLNFIYNLIYSLHAFICFFIFYGMYALNSLEEIEKEMFFIFKTILLLTTLCTLVGLIIIFFKNEITIAFPFKEIPTILKNTAESEYILGIVKKDSGTRFEGVFTNPNIMAFYCSVSIIFCHVLIVSKKFFKIKNKISFFTVVLICIISNFTALILSDSYASFIFFTVYVMCNLFYKIVASEKIPYNKNYVLKSLVFILVGIFFILSLFAVRSYFQNGASDIMSDISSFTSSDINFDKNESDIKFGRPNHDLSSGSGRKVLLKQAYVILKNNFIMGVGPANLLYYGQKYFDSGLIFSNFHNGYISILVSYGMIGFTLFMIFLTLIFSNLFLFLFKNKKGFNNVYPLLFSALVSYLVFALFEKTMLSENNFMCSFFWLILGYAATYAFNTKSLILKTKNKIMGEYK